METLYPALLQAVQSGGRGSSSFHLLGNHPVKEVRLKERVTGPRPPRELYTLIGV